jgi:hypothetical protein
MCLTPTKTSDYLVCVRDKDFGRLSIDGKQVAMQFAPDEADVAIGRVH